MTSLQRTGGIVLALLTVIMTMALPTVAQPPTPPDVPEPITEAVEALSQRVGDVVTLDDLGSYSFEARTFESAALGCPSEAEANSFAQGQIDGYQFLLTYNGITYDYRVADDGNAVRFCDSYEAVSPIEPTAATIPGAVTTAIEALDERLADQRVTFETVTAFDYTQLQFDSAALGCPQDGQSYAQVLTQGYQVMITYAGNVYDYRVADDIVIACESYPADDVAAPQPTSTALGTGNCPPTDPIPVVRGDVATITQGLGSNIRENPSLDAEAFDLLPPGTVVNIEGEPVCTDEIYWFPVSVDGESGWVAQGNASLYYLVPMPQELPAPAALPPLTPDNLTQAQELSQVWGNVTGGAAWSPDGTRIAVASDLEDVPGVWLYDTTRLTNPPTVLETTNAVSAVAFGADELLVTGDSGGTVVFWDATTGDELVRFSAHESGITSVSFNPAGTVLVTVSEQETLSFWGVPQP